MKPKQRRYDRTKWIPNHMVFHKNNSEKFTREQGIAAVIANEWITKMINGELNDEAV